MKVDSSLGGKRLYHPFGGRLREVQGVRQIRGQLNRLLLFLMILLNSQVFFAVGVNPFEIPLLHELFLLLLVLITTVIVVSRIVQYAYLPLLDVLVLGVVSTSFLGSALFAWLYYGQPIIYGMIESRRVLALLIFFPVAYFLRKGYITQEVILRFVVTTAVVCVILGFLAQQGVHFGAYVPLDEETVREDRYTSGMYHVLLAYIVVLALIKSGHGVGRYIFLFFLFWLFVLVVAQTRQLIIVMSLMTIFAINRPAHWLQIACVLAIAGAVLWNLGVIDGYLVRYRDLFIGQLVEGSYLVESARALTIQDIFRDWSENGYAPRGALSLMWNEGFHSYYHSSFYLIDVGWVGAVFRYGVFSIPLMLIFVYVTWKLLFVKTQESVVRDVAKLGVIALWILGFVASPFDYYGYYVGLLMVLLIKPNLASMQSRQ